MMQKWFILFLILSLSLTSVAAEINSTAEMRVRALFNETSDDTDTAFYHRAILGFDYRSGERYQLFTELLHRAAWGDGDEIADNTQVSLRNDDNVVFVHQAYLSWLLDDDVKVTLGRQEIELSNGAVMSANDYTQNPYHWDSFGLFYQADFALVKFWLAQKDDKSASNGTGSDPERNLYILAVDIKTLPKLMNELHVHFIQDSAQAFVNPPSRKIDVGRYGIYAAGGDIGFLYNFNYATESGTEGDSTEVKTSLLDVSVGYKFDYNWKVKIQYNYHKDSGDSDGDVLSSNRGRYNHFFNDQHKFAGRMDIMSFGNLTYNSINLEVEPREKVKVGIEAFEFVRTNASDNTVIFKQAEVSGLTSLKIGQEFDLYYEQMFLNNFNLKFHAGVFQPNNVNLPISGDDLQVMLQGRWVF